MLRVVLPAYNEEEALRELLPAIGEALGGSGLPWEVIVVDDGSRDGTAAVAREWGEKLPVRLAPHEVNRGLAAAMVTGLSAGAEGLADEDVVVAMDADNTHLPEFIPSLLAKLEQGYDVVVASRYQPGSQQYGFTPFRKMLSGGASLLFRSILPIRGVKDYTCGYRAYRVGPLRTALAEIAARLEGQASFSCMVEILVILRRRGLRMAEVPMVLRYDRKPGASKMPVARTVRETLRLLWRERWGR